MATRVIKSHLAGRSSPILYNPDGSPKGAVAGMTPGQAQSAVRQARSDEYGNIIQSEQADAAKAFQQQNEANGTPINQGGGVAVGANSTTITGPGKVVGSATASPGVRRPVMPAIPGQKAAPPPPNIPQAPVFKVPSFSQPQPGWMAGGLPAGGGDPPPAAAPNPNALTADAPSDTPPPDAGAAPDASGAPPPDSGAPNTYTDRYGNTQEYPAAQGGIGGIGQTSSGPMNDNQLAPPSGPMPTGAYTNGELNYYHQDGSLEGRDTTHDNQMFDPNRGEFRDVGPATHGYDENGNTTTTPGQMGGPSDAMWNIKHEGEDAYAKHEAGLQGMLQGTYADEALAGRRMAEMNALQGGGMGGAFAGGLASTAIGGEQNRLKARNEHLKQSLELKMAYLDRMLKQAEVENNTDLQKWLQTEADKTAIYVKQIETQSASSDRQAQARALDAQTESQKYDEEHSGFFGHGGFLGTGI